MEATSLSRGREKFVWRRHGQRARPRKRGLLGEEGVKMPPFLARKVKNPGPLESLTETQPIKIKKLPKLLSKRLTHKSRLPPGRMQGRL